MPPWIRGALKRIQRLAQWRHVRLTAKARHELDTLGLDKYDVREVLAKLTREDAAGRLRSAETGEWMYVFKPRSGGIPLYVKVVVRDACVVVSFHEDDTTEAES